MTVRQYDIFVFFQSINLYFLHWPKPDIIEATNAKNLSYKFDHNDLSILSQQEFKERYNLEKNAEYYASERLNELRRETNVTRPHRKSSYPSSLDWVSLGYVPPVEDQGGSLHQSS